MRANSRKSLPRIRPVAFLLSALLALTLTIAQAGGENSITSPDTDGNVGWGTSLALDGDGYPVVSYHDLGNFYLKLLHCNDPNCDPTVGGPESITVADADGFSSSPTSLVLDGNGFPVVSYHLMKLLHCNDPNCDPTVGGPESITSPAGEVSAGWESSLVLDSSGYPVVGYYDRVGRDLKLLHCNDPNCDPTVGGPESITSPDVAGDVGRYPSLALDDNGFPVVSYYDVTNDDLKLLHCNDPNCDPTVGGAESIAVPDAAGIVGRATSLALDRDGNPVVSYLDLNRMKLLHCNDPNCSGDDESITTPESEVSLGGGTSLVLDGDGNPVVSYQHYTTGGNYVVNLLHCNDPNCDPTVGGAESIAVPDSSSYVGWSTSLELDRDGNPVVSYHDFFDNNDLKLLHCGNANCNTPPTVEAGGPYRGIPLFAIALSSASADDADGHLLSYGWEVDSSACTFSDAGVLNPILTCTGTGSFTVTLAVDDGQGTVSDSAAVSVSVPQGFVFLILVRE